MSKVDDLKTALKIDPDLLDYETCYVNCPECTNIEDDQYYCTTCEGAGVFELVSILQSLL